MSATPMYFNVIDIHCKGTGVRLGPGSREKCLLPPDQIGRSDSQEGRSDSARLRHFSLNFKEK